VYSLAGALPLADANDAVREKGAAQGRGVNSDALESHQPGVSDSVRSAASNAIEN
jgi:hypothetical protein